jgi:hypothetical protein
MVNCDPKRARPARFVASFAAALGAFLGLGNDNGDHAGPPHPRGTAAATSTTNSPTARKMTAMAAKIQPI